MTAENTTEVTTANEVSAQLRKQWLEYAIKLMQPNSLLQRQLVFAGMSPEEALDTIMLIIEEQWLRMKKGDDIRNPEHLTAVMKQTKKANYYRRKGRSPTVRLDDVAEVPSPGSGFRPVEDALEPRARREIVARAIRLLNRQSQLVILLKLEGFSGKEVGELLGVTEDHTRVLLHRAIKQLSTLIEQHRES